MYGDSFKIKVRVKDNYKSKKILVTENGLKILSEDNKQIRTEWGEENE